MNRLFVDSFYSFAILNPADAAHLTAIEFSKHNTAPLVTTAAVLTEVADGRARSANRGVLKRIATTSSLSSKEDVIDGILQAA
jgi:hypothetical protein